MTNSEEHRESVQEFVESYVGIWRQLFTKPAELFAEAVREGATQPIAVFAVVNFLVAGVLAWLGAGRAELLVGFPLALLVGSVFCGALYLVCLRTLKVSADYAPLFRIALIITAVVAIPMAFPLLLLPARLVALFLFCLAFMSVYEVSVGRAVWMALSPLVFALALIVYVLLVFRLCGPWLRSIPFMREFVALCMSCGW